MNNAKEYIRNGNQSPACSYRSSPSSMLESYRPIALFGKLFGYLPMYSGSSRTEWISKLVCLFVVTLQVLLMIFLTLQTRERFNLILSSSESSPALYVVCELNMCWIIFYLVSIALVLINLLNNFEVIDLFNQMLTIDDELKTVGGFVSYKSCFWTYVVQIVVYNLVQLIIFVALNVFMSRGTVNLNFNSLALFIYFYGAQALSVYSVVFSSVMSEIWLRYKMVNSIFKR